MIKGMKRIKYICYYNSSHNKFPREGVPSATTKIDYIINVLNRLGYVVDIISKSGVSSNHLVLDIGGSMQIGENVVRHFISLGCIKNPLRILSRWLNTIHFFLWLLVHTKRNEQIIVYHSLGYCKMLNLLRKIKHLRIIGEVEELYQDVHKQSKSVSHAEYEFVKGCEKYLFPTILLNNQFNTLGKPFAIVHGVYKTEDKLEEKFSDGKIHVVYGGTFDPKKGGAAAAAAAEFLPHNFHIHICGFGDSTEIKKVVDEVQAKALALVSFEGELKGDDYKHFIQKCHIGLSTQNPNAAFNATSFPSKILMYLSNGLKVVSINIPAIALSAVADNVFFYEEQSPDKIAEAIVKASSGENRASLLDKLDLVFTKDLFALLNA